MSNRAAKERKKRALKETLYLMNIAESESKTSKDFSVMGSIGNIYTVNISANSNCNCPDYIRREEFCKHIYFVFYKVLKIPNDLEAEEITEMELENLFENCDSISRSIYANSQLREAFINRVKSDAKNLDENNPNIKKQLIDDNCPICMEDLKSGKIDFCKNGCGKSVHVECFRRWQQKNNSNCVYCRTEWEKTSINNINANADYINVYSITNHTVPQRKSDAYFNYRSHNYRRHFYDNSGSDDSDSSETSNFFGFNESSDSSLIPDKAFCDSSYSDFSDDLDLDSDEIVPNRKKKGKQHEASDMVNNPDIDSQSEEDEEEEEMSEYFIPKRTAYELFEKDEIQNVKKLKKFKTEKAIKKEVEKRWVNLDPTQQQKYYKIAREDEKRWKKDIKLNDKLRDLKKRHKKNQIKEDKKQNKPKRKKNKAK